VRGAGILILIAACYRPELHEGSPCSTDEECPIGLVCSTSVCRFSTFDATPVQFPALPDAPCMLWFMDADGDGHGDPAVTTMACTQPANMVASNDDCDDQHEYRYLSAREMCDGIDNDCNATTADICPSDCSLRQRPAPNDGHLYLFCITDAPPPDARARCALEGYELTPVESDAENTYIRATADALSLTYLHLGGTDAAMEGVWRWSSNIAFWIEPAVVPGQYAHWDSGEPNNAGGTEHCVAMRTTGWWNDDDCDVPRDFVCRR
jgi:hypothetical protein